MNTHPRVAAEARGEPGLPSPQSRVASLVPALLEHHSSLLHVSPLPPLKTSSRLPSLAILPLVIPQYVVAVANAEHHFI